MSSVFGSMSFRGRPPEGGVKQVGAILDTAGELETEIYGTTHITDARDNWKTLKKLNKYYVNPNIKKMSLKTLRTLGGHTREAVELNHAFVMNSSTGMAEFVSHRLMGNPAGQVSQGLEDAMTRATTNAQAFAQNTDWWLVGHRISTAFRTAGSNAADMALRQMQAMMLLNNGGAGAGAADTSFLERTNISI